MSGGPVVVGDRYELGDPLGQGGMATVHRGLDRRLDRPVAVKRLGLHLAADPTALARFRREAQAAASLNHPAIASVFDTGEGTDPATGVALPYIVMELVEGSTLRSLLDAGPLPPERALRVVRSVLDALAHSHAMGLVHRDIKPANVMIATDGAVKVMDFGIARAVDESATSLTKTASVIGTAQYLSPEQALGQTVDLRSDLYSVGCLLFELVTGRPPFVGDTSLAIAYQHVREAPVPPSRLDASLDPGLDAVVLRALTKDPDDRYQTAAEMRDDVDRLLTGRPVAPPPPPSGPPTSADTAALPGRLVGVPAVAVATATTAGRAGPPTAPTARVSPAVADAPPAAADRPGPDDRRRSAAGRALLIALAVFLVLGLGAFGLSRVFGPVADRAGAVTVPDVDGQPRAQAEATLRDAGLVPRVTPTAGKDDKTVGAVVEQAPAADAQVAEGSRVTLTVNTGPAAVEIPDDLVGRPVADVEDELEALGFRDVSTEAVDAGGEVDPGDVVSVKPAEGRRVALDTAIRVRFARGTEAGGSTSGDGRAQAPAPRRSSAPSSSPDDEDAGGSTSEPRGEATSRGPDGAEPTSDATTTSAPPSQAPTDEPNPTTSATASATEEPTQEEPKKPKKPRSTATGEAGGRGSGQGSGSRSGD